MRYLLFTVRCKYLQGLQRFWNSRTLLHIQPAFRAAAMGQDGSEAGPSVAAPAVTPEQLQLASSQYEEGIKHLRV